MSGEARRQPDCRLALIRLDCSPGMAMKDFVRQIDERTPLAIGPTCGKDRAGSAPRIDANQKQPA
jgi:hypothetical protein